MSSPAITLSIDGSRVFDLEDFYDEVSTNLVPTRTWGRNLDAFNDILQGGFGTPEGGFRLVWKNADLSRERLGHDANARFWRDALKRAPVVNHAGIQSLIEQAEAGHGPTLFDRLVEIIRDHGDGGEYAEDGVELVLDGLSQTTGGAS